MACGPPSAVMSSGIVMNGPAPIMFVMFSAVADNRPNRRSSGAAADGSPASPREMGGSCIGGEVRPGTPLPQAMRECGNAGMGEWGNGGMGDKARPGEAEASRGRHSRTQSHTHSRTHALTHHLDVFGP